MGWGPEQKIKFRGVIKFRGRGAMDPNDAMVIVLIDILLCLLGLIFIYIVYIS